VETVPSKQGILMIDSLRQFSDRDLRPERIGQVETRTDLYWMTLKTFLSEAVTKGQISLLDLQCFEKRVNKLKAYNDQQRTGMRTYDALMHEEEVGGEDWLILVKAVCSANSGGAIVVATAMQKAARVLAFRPRASIWRRTAGHAPVGRRVDLPKDTVFSHLTPLKSLHTNLRRERMIVPSNYLAFRKLFEEDAALFGQDGNREIREGPVRAYPMWATFNEKQPTKLTNLITRHKVPHVRRLAPKDKILSCLGLPPSWKDCDIVALSYKLPAAVHPPIKPTVMHSLASGMNYYFRPEPANPSKECDCGYTCPWPDSKAASQPEVVHGVVALKEVITGTLEGPHSVE
jgi:hypothetical protein